MRRWLFGAFCVALALPALYFGSGLIGGVWLSRDLRLSAQTPFQIGLVAGPIHYDLLIPVRGTTAARFAFATQAGVPVTHPAAEWLLVGWEARGFYTSTAALSDI